LHIIKTSADQLLLLPIRSELIPDGRFQRKYMDWNGRNGLYCYNPTTDKTIAYRLHDNYIAGIMEDSNQSIWITTYSGLTKFTPVTNTFKNIFLRMELKEKNLTQIR